ncbi:glucosamine-6-phosphate deaminase [Ammoniphilus sp. CFH 90114]|uniref:glucosamine-6-phosphate deaminase n=1 Tax=Ammoniphilus sp. CFH 90114 TaxID=2493665 RepID=UPI00100EAA11|nr:glucosamine-6-phosphate deaminase [Ammoniphilus sp. CFH 90114]RXT04375.1 glucosamine-6-phosphate deaminase [Ammoniphilus sp. CFH 90114]
MKWIHAKDSHEMSRLAAEFMIQEVKKQPSMVLGLATGGTPVGTYQELIRDARENGTSYKAITTFNLDEYVGLAGTHPNSYRYFMQQQLFEHIDLPIEQTYLPNGEAKDLMAECQRYEELIARHGGIDLQLLGIGTNGHIGFNEPGTSFQSTTHVVTLTKDTREANARFFTSLEEVPTHAITMGIATIMKSKRILLLASGEEKADILYQLALGEVDEKVPASILKQHPDVTIIADTVALRRVKEQELCGLR